MSLALANIRLRRRLARRLKARETFSQVENVAYVDCADKHAGPLTHLWVHKLDCRLKLYSNGARSAVKMSEVIAKLRLRPAKGDIF